MTDNNEKKDYEEETKEDETKKINEESQNLAKILGSILKYFSLFIILFLITSYISNNYIAGIGMNFIPLFIPVGKSFFPKPVLGSMFQPKELPPNSDKFFKKTSLKSRNEEEDKTYYNLLEMGGSFVSILRGVSYVSEILQENNQTEVSLAKIFLVDYDKANWYQKLVLTIFGALQVLVGTVTTLFSSFAYLFSGKHGFLLNLPEEKKRMEAQKKYLFKNKGLSMIETKTNQAVLKSGWSKFGLFFNFINFIFVDKLTYGTRYFVENKHSTFMERLKYFFFILLILILVQSLRGTMMDSVNGVGAAIFLILVIFILFAKRILNQKYCQNIVPNYEGLLNEIKKSAEKNDSKNKDYTFDKLEKDMLSVKDILNKAIQNYAKNSELIAKDLNFEKIPQKSLKDKIKANWDKVNPLKKKESVENAEKTVQQNLAPSEASIPTETTITSVKSEGSQSGGRLRVKEQYRKNIEKLKREYKL